MIVKDEEKCLERCLESVKNIVDEIVIVDTGSKDNTKEIARLYGAEIYDFKWTNDFSAARNYALEKSTGDWNLILDADEYIGSYDIESLENFMRNTKQIGKIMRIDGFMKEGNVEYSRLWISRIIPKGVKYGGRIHEQVESNLPRVNVPIEIHHDGYLHVDKSERNLLILLEQVKDEPTNPYVLYQTAHTLSLANRQGEAEYYFEQFYRYVDSKEAYKCSGIVDYIYNMVAVNRLDKGISVIEKEKKYFYDSPDFNFVCGIFYMNLVLSNVEKYINYLPMIEQSYLTCLDLGESDKYDGVMGTGSFAAAYNLGIWYEVSGNKDKAKVCYEMAAEWGYDLAKKRLQTLE